MPRWKTSRHFASALRMGPEQRRLVATWSSEIRSPVLLNKRVGGHRGHGECKRVCVLAASPAQACRVAVVGADLDVPDDGV